MDSIAALLERTEHPDATALRTGGAPARSYDYRRFRDTARKTGNFLRHLGVGDGATVAVADDPVPEVVFAFLGTALLGETTRFDPPAQVAARVLVAPTPALDGYDLPPGAQRVGYRSEPGDPSDRYFERDVWSENPAFPATTIPPDAPLLVTSDRTVSHADVLRVGRDVAADLHPDDEVALRAPLSRPAAVAAGLVAPLLVGASVLLPDDGDVAGTVAVVAGDADAPEPRRMAANDWF